MRLDKFLAHHLDMSRNVVSKELKMGLVTVNHEICRSGAYKLPNDARVNYRGNDITPITTKRYVMLHKPPGYVCATADADHPTILYFIDEPMSNKMHAAGRLDLDTTGLVLLSDDGQWSHRVTSPTQHFEKEYHITSARPLTDDLVAKFAEGIALKNEKKLTKSANLTIVDSFHAKLILSEGRYHQVKRMFAAVGNHVIALHRQRIGEVELDIEAGQYRHLTNNEIDSFYRSVM